VQMTGTFEPETNPFTESVASAADDIISDASAPLPKFSSARAAATCTHPSARWGQLAARWLEMKAGVDAAPEKCHSYLP
jgi:hypothetical protein